MAYRRRRTYRRRARRYRRRNGTANKKKFCTMPFARQTNMIRPVIEPGSRWIKKRVGLRGLSATPTATIGFSDIWNGLTKNTSGTVSQPYSTASLFNIKIAYVILKCHSPGVNFAAWLNEDQVMQSVTNATERRYDCAARSSVTYAGLKMNIPTAQQLAVQIGNQTTAKWLQIEVPSTATFDILIGLKVQI